MVTRRGFLGALPLGALAARGLLGCAGAPAATVDGGTVTLRFADYPALANVGGGVVVTVGQPLAVVRTATDAAVALSGLCTHQSCPLTYPDGSRLLLCTCHGAQFDMGGGVTRGPATLPLAEYPATVGADAITITI